MAEIENKIIELLGIPIERTNEIRIRIKQSHKFYRHIQIPKKNKSEFRDIYLPSTEIKAFQHIISEVYLTDYPVSKCAYAYVKGRNTKQAVNPHKENIHYLKIDIHDFFDSIKTSCFREIIKNNNINNLSDKGISELLCVLTYKNKFVQGCVTSPQVSNIVFYEIDNYINELVGEISKGVYTRYSDDILISSDKKIPTKILINISDKIREYGFLVNRKKTGFLKNYGNNIKYVGLHILKNNNISIGTEYKKMLKNNIFHKMKSHNSSSESINQIIGKLYYLKFHEPNYFNKINIKYQKEGKLLMTWLKQENKKEEFVGKLKSTSIR